MVTITMLRRRLSKGTSLTERKYHLSKKAFFHRLVGAICFGNHLIVPRRSTIHSYSVSLSDTTLTLIEEEKSNYNTVKTAKPKKRYTVIVDHKADIESLKRAVFRKRMEQV